MASKARQDTNKKKTSVVATLKAPHFKQQQGSELLTVFCSLIIGKVSYNIYAVRLIKIQ